MALRILALGSDGYPVSRDKQDGMVYGVHKVYFAVDQVCTGLD